MKRLILIAAAAVAVFISGCANDQAFIKAQADAATAASHARVAEAEAKAAEAKAVIAVASKLDAGGAAAYVLGLTLRNAGAGAAVPVQQVVQRPRDFLDYLQAFTQAIGTVGNIAVPLVTIREQAKTARAGYDRDVRVEEARQTGESGRVQSVAGIAVAVANGQRPNITTITSTVGGDGMIGDGSYIGPVSTTRDCRGGSAAPGGAGGNGSVGAGGAGASGGSSNGGLC